MPFPRRRASRLRAEPFAIVKGVQRGVQFIQVSDTAVDVTITAVNPARAEVCRLGQRTFPNIAGNEWSSMQNGGQTLQLLNSTTLRITRILGYSPQSSSEVAWQVTEYE